MKNVFLILFLITGILSAQTNSLKNLYKPSNAKTRSISPENFTGEKGKGGMATLEEGSAAFAARKLGQGWKVNPFIFIQAGETVTLGEINEAGIINHMWMTPTGDYRLMILRFYWDDEKEPSVEVPVGDFFAAGWGMDNEPLINSIPVCVNPRSGFNSYWQMPFRKKCKITMENISDAEARLYYQIDYSLENVANDALYFHAQFKRVNPLPSGQVYTIVDNIKGKGQYVGTYIAHGANGYGWWGEGEIKFYMDGDKDFPTICGTGEEDYFCGSYGYEEHLSEDGSQWIYTDFSTPYAGFHHIKYAGKQRRFGQYRWHITDPIRFEDDLKVTIQALGWDKDGSYLPLEDDMASVAYWYQQEPHTKFPALPEPQKLIVNFDPPISGIEERNIFIDETLVTLKPGNMKNEIRYTTDGIEPNKDSKLFTNSFKITEPTTIKANEYSSQGFLLSTIKGDFIKQAPIKSVKVDNVQNGLNYKYYIFDEVPIYTTGLKKRQPVKTGTVDKITFPVKDLANAFGCSFTGYINIPVKGVFTFTLLSNDGSVLYINNEKIVDNDGAHTSEKNSGQAALEKGYHVFQLDYFQAGGGKALKAFIKGPEMDYQEIPVEFFKN
jgi:hypothetical protein